MPTNTQDLRANRRSTAWLSRLRLSALLVVLVVNVVSVRASDWPQFRGPDRDGVWKETGIMKLFPPGGLKVSWRMPVGRGWSSPVVAQGRVYITDVQIERRTATERVLCFDEWNGKLLWSHEYAVDYPEWALSPDAGGPRATPIVRDGKVFTLGALGDLFCLDAVKGVALWEKKLAKDYQVKEFTGITASPLIEGRFLILYICGKPAAGVVAFEVDSGREAWRALDDPFTYSSPIVVTDGGRRQLIVWTLQSVTSLDPATGKPYWREKFNSGGSRVRLIEPTYPWSGRKVAWSAPAFASVF